MKIFGRGALICVVPGPSRGGPGMRGDRMGVSAAAAMVPGIRELEATPLGALAATWGSGMVPKVTAAARYRRETTR